MTDQPKPEPGPLPLPLGHEFLESGTHGPSCPHTDHCHFNVGKVMVYVPCLQARADHLSGGERDEILKLNAAVRALMDKHGWRDVRYIPKKNPPEIIEVIECGSTGIHVVEWHTCAFFTVGDEGWPTAPMLWRPKR